MGVNFSETYLPYDTQYFMNSSSDVRKLIIMCQSYAFVSNFSRDLLLTWLKDEQNY